jgi:SnoaL-like domain
MTSAMTEIAISAVHELVGRWWFNYDEGHFDVLTSLLTDDVHFRCRTDTGMTDYEEFVRADFHGRDDMMAWQREHRLDSPYPLRHNGTNIHIVSSRGDEADFSSYIFVTQIVDGVSNLSTGIVNGTVRRDGDRLRLAALHVVLDTMTSTPLREQPERLTAEVSR